MYIKQGIGNPCSGKMSTMQGKVTAHPPAAACRGNRRGSASMCILATLRCGNRLKRSSPLEERLPSRTETTSAADARAVWSSGRALPPETARTNSTNLPMYSNHHTEDGNIERCMGWGCGRSVLRRGGRPARNELSVQRDGLARGANGCMGSGGGRGRDTRAVGWAVQGGWPDARWGAAGSDAGPAKNVDLESHTSRTDPNPPRRDRQLSGDTSAG